MRFRAIKSRALVRSLLASGRNEYFKQKPYKNLRCRGNGALYEDTAATGTALLNREYLISLENTIYLNEKIVFPQIWNDHFYRASDYLFMT